MRATRFSCQLTQGPGQGIKVISPETGINPVKSWLQLLQGKHSHSMCLFIVINIKYNS